MKCQKRRPIHREFLVEIATHLWMVAGRRMKMKFVESIFNCWNKHDVPVKVLQKNSVHYYFRDCTETIHVWRISRFPQWYEDIQFRTATALFKSGVTSLPRQLYTIWFLAQNLPYNSLRYAKLISVDYEQSSLELSPLLPCNTRSSGAFTFTRLKLSVSPQNILVSMWITFILLSERLLYNNKRFFQIQKSFSSNIAIQIRLPLNEFRARLQRTTVELGTFEVEGTG